MQNPRVVHALCCKSARQRGNSFGLAEQRTFKRATHRGTSIKMQGFAVGFVLGKPRGGGMNKGSPFTNSTGNFFMIFSTSG